MFTLLSDEFRAMSAMLGHDPLQVQGAGGNTSIKDREVMWVKASGTELADALRENIFVAVNLAAARRAAAGEGDSSCKDTLIDPSCQRRPSIETTFHAALPWSVVAHTHSISTLVHATGAAGRATLAHKLQGLNWAQIPYRKPGIDLTRAIVDKVTPQTNVFILSNHGLICCGNSVAQTEALVGEVERRLAMPVLYQPTNEPVIEAPEGYQWHKTSAVLAQHPLTFNRATAGSYYPDHVVFLGPALPCDAQTQRPAILHEAQGVLLREDATSAQRAMLQCVHDVLCRVPDHWQLEPIGYTAEASLLNWDAEKYRQELAKSS